ncbi:Protein kinase-like (PK-like) [Venustampulla echinocandica]|uniref:Protein kinase-like (PK-like) n=1 Tax=Venustampulla echinocandica TaxID=2656787 RepID=A0A370TH16_9HELO|nr:Protein kinase-like (PK-like) [Venustampulla echinocandica]RDL34489.1 Protein kinase-like (PK-like) [Venustampulla echinocandica]
MAPTPDYSLEHRKHFIVNLLQQELGRQVLAIRNLGRDSNNFVHLAELAESVSQPVLSVPVLQQPGTSSLPTGTTKVVIRISHPDAMLNEDIRVQNEVAVMCLMRLALSTYQDALIPNVYAWSPSSAEGYGWILQEYMGGTQIDKEFESLDRTPKEDILRQIADVFKLIQSYSLPESVKGYGGVGFGESGLIITGPTAIPCGGPFPEFQDMYLQMMRRQLAESDTSERLAGWRSTNLRERLESFAANGMKNEVVKNSVARPTLVHGDFNLFNMLFDPTSNRLTALLDFDLSFIGSPVDEYFCSFRSVGSLLVGPFEKGEFGDLRQCLLRGFDSKALPENGQKLNFEIAYMMDKEFVRAGVLRPTDIPGAGELAALRWFLEDVAPPYFFMSRWIAHMEPEKVDEIQASIQTNILKYLESWGY